MHAGLQVCTYSSLFFAIYCVRSFTESCLSDKDNIEPFENTTPIDQNSACMSAKYPQLAHSITGQKLCVCVLTRVAQITAATCAYL